MNCSPTVCDDGALSIRPRSLTMAPHLFLMNVLERTTDPAHDADSSERGRDDGAKIDSRVTPIPEHLVPTWPT